MKAIVHRRYGAPEVLELADVAKPEPKPDEVLVKIAATTVTSADRRLRAFDLPPLFRLPGRLMLGVNGPRNPVLGIDYAGTVEAVGSSVTTFRAGDRVFGLKAQGSYAEYRCVPAEGGIAPIPGDLSFEAAASIPFGGVTALHFLKAAGVKAGQRVLVHGASGGVGRAFVEIGKAMGAHVTGTCRASKIEFVQALGADRVIDYRAEDVFAGTETFDVVADTLGKATWARARHRLAPGGAYLAIVMGGADLMAMMLPRGGKRIISGEAPESRETMAALASLVAAGNVRPCIDRVFPLDEAAAAHAYAETGEARGSVVLSVG